MTSVFTIGIDRRFADELAAGVLAQHVGDPLALADVLILLPTRRSVRALREAFLRATGGKPTLLPRLAPMGDLDESEWEVAAGDGSALDLPPAIEPAEREALLARLVSAFKDDEGHPIAQSAAQALKLARELGRLLDELAIEGVSFSQLEGLVEGNFASHWQRTLKFLAIVGEAWPQVLAERGQIDAIERRTQAIRAQAARWRAGPPATPVIAAGSTGSQPATRDLLAAIAQLPQGAVVLPGLDRDMDEASWKELDQSHPQFGLRELLAALDCERSDVADWPGGGGSARHLLITELMRPAETTEAWSRPPTSSLEHVTRADCATPHQEALVVALALRETLKDEGRTAALVTPDRELARRVASSSAARSPPRVQCGCFSKASKATGAKPSSTAVTSARSSAAGGVSASGAPAESSISTFQRLSSAATRRASSRSGVTRAAVMAGVSRVRRSNSAIVAASSCGLAQS